VLPIPVGNIGGDRPAYRSLRSLASVAPDSVEGQLRAKGKHWTRSGGELNPGDYVEDILVGRLNQPAGRGDIAKVLSVSRGKGSGGERPAAFVDFGRGHSVGIFTTELSRIRFVD
jgi:hypothetical protein